MNRLKNLNSKIFLDSGDPAETKSMIDLLGFLDGQTTNPSLVAKNPEVIADANDGIKLSSTELNLKYKKIIQEISALIPQGSVSIEVYADMQTSTEQMLEQAREMFTWIPNAHIKFPTIPNGLKAAHQAIQEGMRVNMTLVFSQQQAAGVYAATSGAGIGDVFVSPFIGRLDDKGENGMDLIKNIQQMYQDSDKHVQLLAASIRSMEHFYACLQLGVDIITTPYKILEEWHHQGMQLAEDFKYKVDLSVIDFQQVELNQDWQNYNLQHQLTDQGIEKFVADWKKLLA